MNLDPVKPTPLETDWGGTRLTQAPKAAPPIIRYPTPPLLGGPRLARWPGPHTGGQTRLEWELAHLADDGLLVSEAGLYTNQDPTAIVIPRGVRISRWLETLPDRPSMFRRNTEGSRRAPHANAWYAAAGVPISETFSDGVVSWEGLTVPRKRKRDVVKRLGARLVTAIKEIAKGRVIRDERRNVTFKYPR